MLPVPDPVPVTLEPARTALLVLDVTDRQCGRRSQCLASLPAIADVISRFRASAARVVYTLGPGPGTSILPEVAPAAGEPVVQARADKFHGTNLELTLTAWGVTTVVLVGTAANGAVLYTAYAAGSRGFTVVVPTDAVSADDEQIRRLALWQLLNQPGLANPTNTPLAPTAVTLALAGGVTLR